LTENTHFKPVKGTGLRDIVGKKRDVETNISERGWCATRAGKGSLVILTTIRAETRISKWFCDAGGENNLEENYHKGGEGSLYAFVHTSAWGRGEWMWPSRDEEEWQNKAARRHEREGKSVCSWEKPVIG